MGYATQGRKLQGCVVIRWLYLGRKACILICCDEKHELGWYLSRYEHAGAWSALMKRIAELRVAVSDGELAL